MSEQTQKDLLDVNSLEVQSQIYEIKRSLKDTEGYLKAPNGNNSNLSESLWLLTRTELFKQWYGDWANDDSVILDENGEPKVLYHGTPYGGFEQFREDKSFYFSENLDYAERYTNPSASSIRANRGDETYPEIKGVFLRASQAFDTRLDDVRDIHDEQFFGQWGDATELSERGLLDWTQAQDVLEFNEENELGFDVVVVDEGSDPANNEDGFEWRGISYVSTSGSQALTLTGEFTPPSLVDRGYKTEVERQIYQTLNDFRDTDDFMRNAFGKETSLTEKQWATIHSPIVRDFIATTNPSRMEMYVKYAHASLEESSTEFTQNLSNKPYIRLSDSKEETLQLAGNAYPVISKRGRSLYFTEDNLSTLNEPLINESLGWQAVGFDTELVIAVASDKDETIHSYLDYINNYGAEEGESLWMQRYGNDTPAEYLDPNSNLYLNRFANAVFGEYNQENRSIVKELGVSDDLMNICIKNGYTKPLTIESIADTQEKKEEFFSMLKERGIQEVSDSTGESYLLDTSNTFTRSLDNPELSFADLAKYHVDKRIQAQKNENNVNVHTARLNALKEQLEGTEGYLKAPNGVDTKLSETQWLQIQTEEFKSWFGDYTDESQKPKLLLDENGEPQLFYHGTPDITPIVQSGQIFNPTAATYGEEQAWFTPDAQVARTYAKQKPAFNASSAEDGVLANYLKFDNPMVVEGAGRLWRDAQYTESGEHVLDVARKNGNDGVIIKDVHDSYMSNHENSTSALGKKTDTYVTFNKHNVKSATLNSGSFSNENTDIRYSIAETTQVDEKYLELASAYVDGDLSVESELQTMVYQHALNSGYTDNYDYRMRHEAPYADEEGYHSSLEDVSDMYGDDIYTSNALSYFRTGFPVADAKAIRIIQQNRDDEDAMIKIYRAVPKDTPDVIYNRDWVAITKEYAKIHGESVLKGNYKIIENTVPAKYLYTEGNSIQEWGYDNGQLLYREELGNTQKLSDLVTFDDDGEIIPLSARFDNGDDDVRYSFAGINARTANPTAFKQALSLLESGAMKAQVAKQTGWHVGADQKMRFIISDADAQVKDISLADTKFDNGVRKFSLDTVLQHEQLFEAYPELKDIKVNAIPIRPDNDLEPKAFGDAHYNASLNRIDYYVDNLKQVTSPSDDDKTKLKAVLLHEIQHVIQNIEGFNKGTSIHTQQAMPKSEFYAKTGVFERLEKQKESILSESPVEFQELYEQINSTYDSLQKVYTDEQGHFDFDNVPNREAENYFDLINEASEKYTDEYFALQDIEDEEREYKSDETIQPFEQYLHWAGEVEARKTEAMALGNQDELDYIEKAYPDYLQVIEFDTPELVNRATLTSTSQLDEQAKQKVDSVKEQVREYLGDKTYNRLVEQGKLNIVANHSVPNIEGFYEKGKTTLVANNLNKDTVIPTLLHEIGGHAGFQKMLKPKQYQRLLNQFNDLVQDNDGHALKAKRLAERDVKNKDDEYLPYYLTVTANEKSNSLVKNTVSSLKAWAFEKIGAPIKLNANDMVALSERLIKKYSSPKVKLSKEGSKLASTADSTPQVLRANTKRDSQNNAIGKTKPEVQRERFITKDDDIFTVSATKVNGFRRAVDYMLKSGNENEVLDFDLPESVKALDGYLHKDLIGKSEGGLKRCRIDENKKLRLSGWMVKKVRGLVDKYRDDKDHSSTDNAVKSILEDMANPVAIIRSTSTDDGYLFLTDKESKGNPLLIVMQTDKNSYGEVTHYISSMYGKSSAQDWLTKQAKTGNMLYFNPKKFALGVNNKALEDELKKLDGVFQPLTPGGLRQRHLDRENNKMKISLDDQLEQDNAIHEVFKHAASQKILMTDEEIKRSFYQSVIPEFSDVSVQTSLVDGKVTIGGKEFSFNHKVKPASPAKANDPQYQIERNKTLQARLKLNQKMRVMVRGNDGEKVKLKLTEKLEKEQRKYDKQIAPADRNPRGAIRYEDLPKAEVEKHLTEMVESVSDKYDIALQRKLGNDFKAMQKFNDSKRTAEASRLVSSNPNMSFKEAQMESIKRIPPAVHESETMKKTFPPLGEYSHLIEGSVTPMVKNYRKWKRLVPDSHGIAPDDKIGFLSKSLALLEKGYSSAKRASNFVPKPNSELSHDRVMAKTYKLSPAGEKMSYGASIIQDGKAEVTDGQFMVVSDNYHNMLSGYRVASTLDNIVLTETLEDAVGYARYLEQKKLLHNTLVVSALDKDNLPLVASQFMSLNEHGNIQVLTNDPETHANILNSSVNNDNVKILQTPINATWGRAYMDTATVKGFSGASHEMDKMKEIAESRYERSRSSIKSDELPKKPVQVKLKEAYATKVKNENVKQQTLDFDLEEAKNKDENNDTNVKDDGKRISRRRP